MKWVFIVLGGIVVLVAVIAAVGAMLPKGHVASRTARYAQPLEKIWDAVTGVDEFMQWRADLKSAGRLPDQNGKPRWKEVLSDGTEMPLDVEAWEPPRRLVLRIANPDLPFGGTWTFDIAAVEGGATLTITEKGEIHNVLFRALARFVFGYTSTIEKYHAALAKKFGQPLQMVP